MSSTKQGNYLNNVVKQYRSVDTLFWQIPIIIYSCMNMCIITLKRMIYSLSLHQMPQAWLILYMFDSSVLCHGFSLGDLNSCLLHKLLMSSYIRITENVKPGNRHGSPSRPSGVTMVMSVNLLSLVISWWLVVWIIQFAHGAYRQLNAMVCFMVILVTYTV